MKREKSLQEHGRRGQQRGPGARRPGAAAEAAGAAAAASSGCAGAAEGAAAPASAAPRLREARRAEEHDEQESAQWQDPPHRLHLISQAIATLTERRPAAVNEWFLRSVQEIGRAHV